MKRVDVRGTVFLLDDSDSRYTYKIIKAGPNGEWPVLLRDDGYRIYSMYIGEKPTNKPLGERDFELLWEYKQTEGPGHREVVEMIMRPEGKDE
jgi:hypothetical protein